jgi:hypothetical protein
LWHERQCPSPVCMKLFEVILVKLFTFTSG